MRNKVLALVGSKPFRLESVDRNAPNVNNLLSFRSAVLASIALVSLIEIASRKEDMATNPHPVSEIDYSGAIMFYAFMTALSPSLMFSCAMASMLPQTEALISVDIDRITSILPWAVASGNADAVTELLEHAKTLDPEALEKVLIAKDIDGKTPLHLAAFDGRTEIAELLIAKGANPNTKDNEGDTPLHLAVAYGHTDILRILLDAGADVNARFNDGYYKGKRL